MPIVFRISSAAVDFTTDLVARYLFTSDASDSLGNHDDATTGVELEGSWGYDSDDGVTIARSADFRIQFGSDGSSTHLSTTLNDLGTNTGTISFWIKPGSFSGSWVDDATSDDLYIFGAYRGSNGVPHFTYQDENSQVDAGSGGWHFWTKQGTGSSYEGADWVGDAGTDWVHIVLTINGSDIRMYKDGSLADSYTATSGWPIASQEWVINGVAGADTGFWDGHFKDLSVWSGRVLSATEVAALNTNGHGGSY